MIGQLISLALSIIFSIMPQQCPTMVAGSCGGGGGGGTPTLMLSHGTSGLDGGRDRLYSLNNIKFNLEPSGYPRAVTAGEAIFMLGGWPDSLSTASGFATNCASHCLPTFSDDKSNTWNNVFSVTTPCQDAQGRDHGIYYVQNAAAATSVITENHPAGITDSHWTWAHFYNMATTSMLDGTGSCTTGQTPVNNTPPNISGTAYTISGTGDLVITCVDDEGGGDIGSGNTWSSITWPTSFTAIEAVAANSLGSSPGHACAYSTSIASGSFTPTFTVSQTTHSAFTIYSAAFKSGSGGSAPVAGKAILLSQQYITGGALTYTTNLPCPTSTTGIIIADDAGNISSVSTSPANTFTKVQSAASLPQISYAVNISVASTNALTVSVVSGGAGVDEIGFYCTNNTAVDTATTAANTSSNIGASTGGVTNTQTETTGAGNCQGTAGTLVTCSDLPSWTPGVSGDLTITVGVIGTGPATQCTTTACVFDDPMPITVADLTGGTHVDANNYSNGDAMGHHWQSSNAAINEIWKAIQNASSFTNIAVTFK